VHLDEAMYRKNNKEQLEFKDFYLPFGGKIRSDNRWMKLAKVIPWEDLEDHYAALFSDDQGAPAKPFRMALGALIIKERLSITDEETVAQICENPYLQYFIGLHAYHDEAPFDPSMMVHFRKRLSMKVVTEINDRIVKEAMVRDREKSDNGGVNGSEGGSSGKEKKDTQGIMMIDASVAPADISYPTDLSLLNDAREKLEKIIDVLYELDRKEMTKPRTYREKARRDYLAVAKRRKQTKSGIRKAIRKQLQYIRRDRNHIELLCKQGASLILLSRHQYRDLLVIHELFRQQEEMYRNKTHSIDNRIVNIAQPHVRPMVRGKASAQVEFGAKIVVSRIEGYHVLEELSWDSFNESTLLKDQIERYKDRTGLYPEAVLADKLYRNRENIQYCRERNIRLSGPRLGRPSKDQSRDKKQERDDSGMRNAIEGSFGVGKRRYGLSRIMAKLSTTSESTSALILLVMNLEKCIRHIFVSLLKQYVRIIRWNYYAEFQGI
jgi:IS5 family transposase